MSEIKIGLCLKNFDYIKNLKEFMSEVNDSGVDFIHLDIFDGCMVKEHGLSSSQIKDIRALTKLPIEAHLMLNYPRHPKYYKTMGIDRIILNHETYVSPRNFFIDAKKYDLETGIALKPTTDHSNKDILCADLVDCVLVMGTKSGTAGKTWDENTPKRIQQVRQIYSGEIEANCGLLTLPNCRYGDSTTYLAFKSGATRLAMERGLLSIGLSLKDAVKLNRDIVTKTNNPMVLSGARELYKELDAYYEKNQLG